MHSYTFDATDPTEPGMRLELRARVDGGPGAGPATGSKPTPKRTAPKQTDPNVDTLRPGKPAKHTSPIEKESVHKRGTNASKDAAKGHGEIGTKAPAKKQADHDVEVQAEREHQGGRKPQSLIRDEQRAKRHDGVELRHGPLGRETDGHLKHPTGGGTAKVGGIADQNGIDKQLAKHRAKGKEIPKDELDKAVKTPSYVADPELLKRAYERSQGDRISDEALEKARTTPTYAGAGTDSEAYRQHRQGERDSQNASGSKPKEAPGKGSQEAVQQKSALEIMHEAYAKQNSELQAQQRKKYDADLARSKPILEWMDKLGVPGIHKVLEGLESTGR